MDICLQTQIDLTKNMHFKPESKTKDDSTKVAYSKYKKMKHHQNLAKIKKKNRQHKRIKKNPKNSENRRRRHQFDTNSIIKQRQNTKFKRTTTSITKKKTVQKINQIYIKGLNR